MSVQYSGVGGREPRLRADVLAARFRDEIAPLRGAPMTAFRDTARWSRARPRATGSDRRCSTPRRTVPARRWPRWSAPSGGSGARSPASRSTRRRGRSATSTSTRWCSNEVDSLPHGLINTPSSAAGEIVPTCAGCATASCTCAGGGLRARSCTSMSTDCSVRRRRDTILAMAEAARAVRAARRAPVRRGLACGADPRDGRRCASSSRAGRRSSPTNGRTRSTTSAPSTPPAPRTWCRSRPRTSARSHTPSTRSSTARPTASSPTSAARARRPSAQRAGQRSARGRRGRRPAAGQARDGR